jgi:hypothetical protein
MNTPECVGPRGRRDESVPSGCPTRPRYHLERDAVDVWACERHLSQAVKAFGIATPVAVSMAA